MPGDESGEHKITNEGSIGGQVGDLSRVLGVLAQDLRRNLVGTAGMAELALVSAVKDQTRQQLEEVMEGLNGALDLVDDVMSFTGAFDQSPVDDVFTFPSLFEASLDQARRQAQRSSIIISQDFSDDCKKSLKGDRRSCEVLLTALLRHVLTESPRSVVALIIVLCTVFCVSSFMVFR